MFKISFKEVRCRVCERKNTLRVLFKKENELLIEMLMKVANITVRIDDELPKCICSPCVEKLIVAYNFKIECERTDRKLRCKYGLLNENNEKKNVVSETPKAQKCDKATQIGSSAVDVMANHPEITAEKGTSMYECRQCGMCVMNANQLCNHFLNHQLLSCPICKKRFLFRDDLEEHVDSHNDHINIISMETIPKTANKSLRAVPIRNTKNIVLPTRTETTVQSTNVGNPNTSTPNRKVGIPFVDVTTFECYTCGRCFNSLQELDAHWFAEHRQCSAETQTVQMEKSFRGTQTLMERNQLIKRLQNQNKLYVVKTPSIPHAVKIPSVEHTVKTPSVEHAVKTPLADKIIVKPVTKATEICAKPIPSVEHTVKIPSVEHTVKTPSVEHPVKTPLADKIIVKPVTKATEICAKPIPDVKLSKNDLLAADFESLIDQMPPQTTVISSTKQDQPLFSHSPASFLKEYKAQALGISEPPALVYLPPVTAVPKSVKINQPSIIQGDDKKLYFTSRIVIKNPGVKKVDYPKDSKIFPSTSTDSKHRDILESMKNVSSISTDSKQDEKLNSEMKKADASVSEDIPSTSTDAKQDDKLGSTENLPSTSTDPKQDDKLDSEVEKAVEIVAENVPFSATDSKQVEQLDSGVKRANDAIDNKILPENEPSSSADSKQDEKLHASVETISGNRTNSKRTCEIVNEISGNEEAEDPKIITIITENLQSTSDDPKQHDESNTHVEKDSEKNRVEIVAMKIADKEEHEETNIICGSTTKSQSPSISSKNDEATTYEDKSAVHLPQTEVSNNEKSNVDSDETDIAEPPAKKRKDDNSESIENIDVDNSNRMDTLQRTKNTSDTDEDSNPFLGFEPDGTSNSTHSCHEKDAKSVSHQSTEEKKSEIDSDQNPAEALETVDDGGNLEADANENNTSVFGIDDPIEKTCEKDKHDDDDNASHSSLILGD